MHALTHGLNMPRASGGNIGWATPQTDLVAAGFSAIAGLREIEALSPDRVNLQSVSSQSSRVLPAVSLLLRYRTRAGNCDQSRKRFVAFFCGALERGKAARRLVSRSRDSDEASTSCSPVSVVRDMGDTVRVDC